jgi:predicted permease
MSLVSQLGSMLGLLVAGVALRSTGVLGAARRDRLTTLAFYVALPALVFSATVSRPPGAIVSGRLLVGVAIVLYGFVALGLVVHRHRPDPARRAVAVVGSYHGNMGFLGLPFVATAFGGLAAAKASLVLGISALIHISTTVVVLTRLTGAETQLRAELAELVRNPVLLALMAGLTGATVGLVVPPTATRLLETLGALALPIALLTVGATFTRDQGLVDSSIVGQVAALKLVAMPLVALGVFMLLEPVASTVRAAVVMLAMPTAVSTYIYADELGGDADLASATVVATTAVALLTLYPVILLIERVLRAAGL